jgi:hydroxymethylbilane synthase
MNLRIGTRGSDLARTQAEQVAAALTALGATCELTIIRTAGDRSQAPSFIDIGPQGVFVREIEQALLDGQIDLAVHSYKDLPSRSPGELHIAAVPARRDPADVLVLRAGAHTDHAVLPLRAGAVVGTSSVRRQTWLKHARPDLVLAPLRGNVPTRLKQLADGRFDAIVLAAAGIERLRDSHLGTEARAQLEGLSLHRLDPQQFVPAPSQGALAIQCRAADRALGEQIAALEHAPSRSTVGIERALLAHVQGGCDVPFGAYCTSEQGTYRLWAMFEHGGRVSRRLLESPAPETLADRVWAEIDRTVRACAR